MYDFWFTLGSAIINTALIDEIFSIAVVKNVPVVFKPIGSREIIDPDDGTTPFDSTNTATAGLLDPGNTATLRTAIRNFFAIPKISAPPISIYATGRMAQLVSLPNINLGYLVKDPTIGINGAYTDAVKALTHTFSPSQGFAAALGLSLIDATLRAEIAKPSQCFKDFTSDFGLSDDEITVLTNTNSDKRFAAVSSSLLNGNGLPLPGGTKVSTPWQDLCSDQFFFWDTQNRRAVL